LSSTQFSCAAVPPGAIKTAEPAETATNGDANGDGDGETKTADTKLVVKSEAEAQEIVRKLEGASYRVIGVEKKRRTKSSYLPYITSTMQQDASSRLRFAPRRTMRVAQDLYEGIELGDEGFDFFKERIGRSHDERIAPRVDADR